LWFGFYRIAQGRKQCDVQWFVRVEAGGVGFGLHIPATPNSVLARFQHNAEQHCQGLFDALHHRGAFEHFVFSHEVAQKKSVHLAIGNSQSAIRNPLELAGWAMGKSLTIVRFLPRDSILLRWDDLVGEIQLGWEELLPAYACAVEPDPRP